MSRTALRAAAALLVLPVLAACTSADPSTSTPITVKGSAGIFGLDRVVAFTHHVETLLDRVREGRVALTPELSTLLLQCNDQIRILVTSAQDPHADNPQAGLDAITLIRAAGSYAD